jgi:hypothetical protein
VDARSQHDYIALSRLFHTVMVLDVPVMTKLMESEARRFIALVDEFYERHVKLVVSAEVPLYEIYQGERLKFEFQRCLSRLQEMQSEEYLKRSICHKCHPLPWRGWGEAPLPVGEPGVRAPDRTILNPRKTHSKSHLRVDL